MPLKTLTRRAGVLVALAILAACGAERATMPLTPRPELIAPVGPLMAQGTPTCVTQPPPNINQGTNTGTYVVYNSTTSFVSFPTVSASALPPCSWRYQAGNHCGTIGGSSATTRCYSFPHAGGVGVIPVFIYSVPVDATYRSNVRQNAAIKNRFRFNTRPAVMGVRG
jgi:hypothetical protein